MSSGRQAGLMSSGRHEGIPRSTAYNLGAAPVAAKGTTQDYLAYLSAIPAQIMALGRVFSGVVKVPGPPGSGIRAGLPL
jgi:hypothetical protein